MGPDWARPVVHFEIRSPRPERLREFYAALFGWRIGTGEIMTIEPGIGGPEPGPGGHLRRDEQAGVSLYVQVRDLADTLRRVPDLGGSVTLEPLDVPGGATIAAVRDPDGNTVGLVQQ